MVGYTPDRGDIVWMSFDPQMGHEQSGVRPAVILSPIAYNARVGLALMCPITSKSKGFLFEVAIPESLSDYVTGVVLSDQVKSFDWRARRAEYIVRLPDETLALVTAKLLAILDQ